MTTSVSHGITCPNCQHETVEQFYAVQPVPVHSVLLVPSREEALHFPAGRIALGYCRHCGFITNSHFDDAQMHYSPRCEETQGFSATFRSFHRRLALDLIDSCQLRNKTVLEIGCGKGEFISMLCALGNNRGIGFDPAFVPQRRPEEGGDAVEFYQDFYSEKYAHLHADFIVCKMTLEHIPSTLDFVTMVRRAVGSRFDTTVFFQVPEMGRVLRDIAFWDIYHEHCSYFTPGALRNLFRLSGFEVLRVWQDYDGQYLMITARPALPHSRTGNSVHGPSQAEQRAVSNFAAESERRVHFWKQMVTQWKARGQRGVIWGSGSKGVAFLSALGAHADDGSIEYAVDINPYRHGCFMPGTGQEIVSPAFLTAYQPDFVIAMNSIYTTEIESELRRLGLGAAVLPIEAVEAIA